MKTIRLGQVCRPRQWPTISQSDLLPEGFPVYGANSHIGFYHTYNHEESVVAVTCRGATCGEVSFIPPKSYVTGNAMCLDEMDENQLLKIYAFQALRHFGLKNIVSGSAQPQIIAQDVRKYSLPIPPLPEQRKIADILSTWDEALETLDALIATKTRQKQALMQQLLTGKTRVKGAKGKWKKIRMGELLERVFRPIEWHSELPLNLVSLRRRCGGLFRRPAVNGSGYKTKDLHEIRAGDFLISKRQVVHGAWGYVTPAFEGGHVSKEYVILDNRAPDKLHMPFFAWLAQTGRLIRLARVSSTGVHIEKLIFDPAVFLRESIRIPADLAEQQQIATILDTADHELTLLRTQRQTLDQQKRGLMQRLLTGKIRVNP
ncbi:MAG: restriction endonuclease subunit S [Luteolibacter sp.]